MAITTTSILPSPVQQTFSYKLLAVPVPNMIHRIAAVKKEMPRNGGNTLRMRRYNPLNTAMVPLQTEFKFGGLVEKQSSLAELKSSLIDLDGVVH